MPTKTFNFDKFIDIASYPVDYKLEEKETFLKMCKTLAQMTADCLGLSKDEYDIRVNKGGIAVSGEVTLHSDNLYVQFGQGILNSFLCRTCKGRKDYTGGVNHYYKWEDLRNFDNFIEFLRKLR